MSSVRVSMKKLFRSIWPKYLAAAMQQSRILCCKRWKLSSRTNIYSKLLRVGISPETSLSHTSGKALRKCSNSRGRSRRNSRHSAAFSLQTARNPGIRRNEFLRRAIRRPINAAVWLNSTASGPDNCCRYRLIQTNTFFAAKRYTLVIYYGAFISLVCTHRIQFLPPALWSTVAFLIQIHSKNINSPCSYRM